MLTGPTDPRHGKYTTYCNHGCRCPACREAWRVYVNEKNHRLGRHRTWGEYLAQLAQQTPPPHGTESRYTKGCRCEECVRAATEARKRRRRSDPERDAAYQRDYRRRKREAA
jgi:hypothetical protein